MCSEVPSFLNHLPISLPILPYLILTEPLFEFHESYSKFPLAIYFIHGLVSFHVPLSMHRTKHKPQCDQDKNIRRNKSQFRGILWNIWTALLKTIQVIKNKESHRVSPVGWWSGLCYLPKPRFNPWSRNWDSTSLTVRPKQNKEILRNCHGQEAPKEIGWLNVIQYPRWDPGKGKRC